MPNAELTPVEREFMRAIGRLCFVVPKAIGGDLTQQWGIQLSEFFVLNLVAESPGGRVRLSALAESLEITISGVSRMATKLEGAGLVARERSGEDGRGFDLLLTDAGAKLVEDALPDYAASARRHVLAHFEPEDLPSLAQCFRAVATGD